MWFLYSLLFPDVLLHFCMLNKMQRTSSTLTLPPSFIMCFSLLIAISWCYASFQQEVRNTLARQTLSDQTIGHFHQCPKSDIFLSVRWYCTSLYSMSHLQHISYTFLKQLWFRYIYYKMALTVCDTDGFCNIILIESTKMTRDDNGIKYALKVYISDFKLTEHLHLAQCSAEAKVTRWGNYY